MTEIKLSYLTVRQSCLEANAKMTGKLFCETRANCCVADTPLTQEDINLIRRAVKNGEVSKGNLEEVRQNVSDKTRADVCPFLDKNKRCLIYDVRPLKCIGFGFEGAPLSQKKFNDRLSRQRKYGVEQGVPIKHLKYLGSCGECADLISEKNVFIPLSCLMTANAEYVYVYEHSKTTTKEFAKELVS